MTQSPAEEAKDAAKEAAPAEKKPEDKKE